MLNFFTSRVIGWLVCVSILCDVVLRMYYGWVYLCELSINVRACLNLFRPGWNDLNGTRLFVVDRSITSCLCPFRISKQPSNRPDQKITQLTLAAGPRSSTRRQGCRHVGSECS